MDEVLSVHCPFTECLKHRELVYEFPKDRPKELEVAPFGVTLESLPLMTFSEVASSGRDLHLATKIVAKQVEDHVVGAIVNAECNSDPHSSKVDQLVRWMVHESQKLRYYGPWAVLKRVWSPKDRAAAVEIEGIAVCVASPSVMRNKDVYLVQLTPDVARLVIAKYFEVDTFSVETVIAAQVRHDWEDHYGIVRGTLEPR